MNEPLILFNSSLDHSLDLSAIPPTPLTATWNTENTHYSQLSLYDRHPHDGHKLSVLDWGQASSITP